MPSLTFTPGGLRLAGAEINPEPVRFGFTAGTLRLSGATITAGPSLASSVSAILAGVLDTLFSSEAIVDPQGRPTRRFQQIWANAIQSIKDAFETQGLSIAELERIYAGINAAQATATEAVQQSQVIARDSALTDSFTSPLNVLTASSGGAVTVAAHTRVYGDGTSASVDAGSITGFASGAYVTIYYSDPARAGGAVTYLGSTDVVAQAGDTHVVGQITIPDAGQADTGGTGTTPPGYSYPPNYDPRAV